MLRSDWASVFARLADEPSSTGKADGLRGAGVTPWNNLMGQCYKKVSSRIIQIFYLDVLPLFGRFARHSQVPQCFSSICLVASGTILAFYIVSILFFSRFRSLEKEIRYSCRFSFNKKGWLETLASSTRRPIGKGSDENASLSGTQNSTPKGRCSKPKKSALVDMSTYKQALWKPASFTNSRLNHGLLFWTKMEYGGRCKVKRAETKNLIQRRMLPNYLVLGFLFRLDYSTASMIHIPSTISHHVPNILLASLTKQTYSVIIHNFWTGGVICLPVR